ncbi:hypothetical protein K458DRAFT_404515 [Lentithecium fluviatile CBS 122367]|uniref:Myb-like domain-containing protein n=1 Tax=Lentithecium fluviatile CBS 122367 TaxID=1168545 RepID=A0A6G1J154_9PLEO|nr:hypothetical protein K458DRAFT_404515 [Lentithecium fluviatile CBS 122367]
MSSTSEVDGRQGESHALSSSSNEELATASRPVSATPFSPRKRRRSSSPHSSRARKRHLDGKYSDAYRILYNDAVTAAASRFVADGAHQLNGSRIGVSRWSADEKSAFFAALDRLGRDDVPGIAHAVGTKSTLETRQFLLLIQQAHSESDSRRRNARVALQDIPAALEVGVECGDRLASAGDALAWYQERFEAKQEQERYGKYWLITPEVANDIEEAIVAPKSTRSSPGNENADEKSHVIEEEQDPPVLQEIPEAKLLDPSVFLDLSKHYFMNPSPTVIYPWPHWSELTSELAAEPSIYRSAFKDLHTLVVSLARRLVQTVIIQATARMRSQGRRVKKGVSPFVKRRDVLTTLDILGLSRNSSERWRGMARRCGLRVTRGVRRAGGRGLKRTVEVSWDEVERRLQTTNILDDALSTDAETAGLTSETDEDNFKARAVRGGTPLPTVRPSAPSDSEENEDPHAPLGEDDDSDSDLCQPPDDEASDASMLDETLTDAEPPLDTSEGELDAVEAFDQTASREEERKLLNLLGDTPSMEDDVPKPKAETEEPEARHKLRRHNHDLADDWRSWTQYRATWEELRTPVPHSSFLANKKCNSPTAPLTSIEGHTSDSGPGTRRSSARDGGRGQTRERREADLPIRGARAYAAMQERASSPVNEDAQSADEDDNDVEIPAPSIEVADEDNASKDSEHDDAMELD